MRLPGYPKSLAKATEQRHALQAKADPPVIHSELFSSFCFHGFSIFIHLEAFMASSASWSRDDRTLRYLGIH